MISILKRATTFLFLLLVLSTQVHSKDNPMADPRAIVISGNMRFTVLTPEMVRMEWSDSKQFEDRASFIVINRNLPVPAYTSETKDGYLYIKTAKLELRYKTGTNPQTNPASSENLKVSFNINGIPTYWFPGKKDPLNLKGTSRTLDHSKGDNMRSVMEDGLLSRSGWALIDESKPNGDTSKSLLFENQGGDFEWVAQRKPGNSIDWYFMAYGNDYKKALLDFTKVGGKIPMPPLYSLGYWYSKYDRYTEQDFKDIVNEIQQNDIPIDVMVVDMDWHYAGDKRDAGRGGWTGWTWNKSLFPDPEEFLGWLHSKNLKVTMNLHPADGIAPDEDNFKTLANDLGLPNDKTIKWNIENQKFYKYFFQDILRPHENIGADFWWLDWQQWLIAPEMADLGNTFWLNHVYYNDMRINRPDRRPMIFHRWGGLGNHRYPIGFSGDTWATFPTLAFQVYFNSTASNVAYGYWSHDLGGHNQSGPNDPELYLRWIQFGIFSPITRSHATNAPHIERRIWKYPNFSSMRDALKLRYALIPYIYTYARKAYDTGESICRPLYYDSPQENEAYKQETSYMFGDEILVSPIVTASEDAIGTSDKYFWLPKGRWMEAETGNILDGNRKYLRSFAQNEIPFYYKEGSVIPMYPDNIKQLKQRPDTLIIQFIPGESGSFSFYEDEGDNEKYKYEKYTTTKITQQTNVHEGVYTIHAREGAFDNMPVKRSYELKLLSILPPKRIIVDGKVYNYSKLPKQGYWTYDSKQLAVCINIPQKNCKIKTQVLVDYDANQSGSKNLIAGKMGQLSRLVQCNDSLKLKIGSQMPVLFTKLVETRNRIGENPLNITAELQYFETNLGTAFDQLSAIGNAPVDEIRAWKDFILGDKKIPNPDLGNSNKKVVPGYDWDGSNLWIRGSAIPDNVAILTEDPVQSPGYFRYHGKLQPGEFKMINTPTVQPNTKYYVPASEEENATGTSLISVTDRTDIPGWHVNIADNYYKIKINVIANTLSGEIFNARDDLFIVGGATKSGWDSGRSIRLKKDLNNPNLFVFSGVLGEYGSGNDRNMFKLLGQPEWGPISFHSKTPKEKLPEFGYIYENLPGDNKWSVDAEKLGLYEIKVDLLEETISSKYIDSSEKP